MRNFIKYLAFSAVLFLMSCYGKNENNFYDLGKHTFNGVTVKINDVVKEDADTSDVFSPSTTYPRYVKNIIVVDAGDKVDIAINSTLTGDFVPQYKWEMMETDPERDPITNEWPKSIPLGDTKDISFEINGAPIEYTILCTITNTKDNTQDYLAFIFKINKPNGLAIIYNGDNGGDFDFLKNSKNTLNQTKVEYYRNVYSATNGSYIEEPKTLFSAKGSFGAPNVFITFNNKTIVGLDYITLKVTQTDQSKFFALEAPTYSTSYMLANGNRVFAVFDDQVYYSGSGFGFGWSLDPVSSYMPLIIGNEGSSVSNAYYIFFEKNKKAFRYGNFNGKLYSFVTRAGSLFDINDTKMDLIYGESGFQKNVNMIMKKGSQLYYNILDLQYGRTITPGPPAVKQTDVSVLIQHDITALQGLTENSLWAMNTRGKTAFYTSGNKIYIYNQELNTSTDFSTVEGNITMIKVFRHANDLLNGKTLYVGTDTGKLYEFSIEVVSGTKEGEPTIYDIDGIPMNVIYI